MNTVTSKSFRTRAALYTLITASVAVGACASVQAGEACAVAQSARPGNAVTVSYRDLNLATAEGAHALYARITHAARSVCSAGDIRDLGAVAASQVCQREAIAQAVGTVHSSQLAALLNTKPPQG
ncbi:MAG TPA: UrcA family protein [Steroidobacteraceae bacterium]|jgi:UrcA family protein